MDLGLDVGTGTTKLARYPGGGRAALRKVVPTAVVYRGLVSEIPAFSPGQQSPADEVRCDGFPAMLGVRPTERVTAWGGRTGIEVTQSFLHFLLSRFLNRADGKEGQLVVTVPPVGAVQARRGRARDTGTELTEILGALGHPPQRFLPAPIAALAYLRRDRPELAETGRFAVCDIGAGGISLALCAATASGARIVDIATMTGAAAWGGDTVPGAVTGNRVITLIECLAAEIARIGGVTAATADDERLAHRWRALEAVLDRMEEDDSVGGDLRALFGACARRPGFGVLRFADVEVPVAGVLEACTPLAETASALLTSLLARQADPGWRHFGTGTATRITLIGGLTSLAPIRAALLRVAGLDPHDPGGAVVEADPADRLCAPALGAALVATGQADPSVRYPYNVRLPVHREVLGHIESSYLELAAAGTVAPDQAETPVMGTDGAPVVVTVRPSPGPVPLSVTLPVQLVHGDGAPQVPAEFHPAQSPPADDYQVSVSGDPAGLAIVLRSLKADRVLRYVLRQPADRRGDLHAADRDSAADPGCRARGLPGSAARHADPESSERGEGGNRDGRTPASAASMAAAARR